MEAWSPEVCVCQVPEAPDQAVLVGGVLLPGPPRQGPTEERQHLPQDPTHHKATATSCLPARRGGVNGARCSLTPPLATLHLAVTTIVGRGVWGTWTICPTPLLLSHK